MRCAFLLLLALSAVASQPALAAPDAAPAKPAADSTRVALGGQIAAALWPDGSYARIVKEMIGGEDGVVDMVLNLRASDVVGEEALKKASKDGKVPPEARKTMREAMRAKDPHFEERMRLTMHAVGDEMGRVFGPLEPKMRKGLAHALARRFDEAQLRDIAAFFSTASGQAYAEQSLFLFTDKALLSEMMSAVPEMMKEMPQMMERVKKATAHLPPPPKPESEKGEAAEPDDGTS